MDQRRVTVLNQSEEFLALVDVLLEEDGPYEVTTMRLPDTTIDDVAATEPQLVIVDVTTSGAVAESLLRDLLRHPSLDRIPVVLTTPDSPGAAGILDEFRDHPRVTTLPKPFTAAALSELADRLTAGKG